MAKLTDLEKDAYNWVNNLARNSAKEIMNGLAEAGPEWSGDFKDSWIADAAGAGTGGGGGYPYSLKEIPRLPATKREVERRTKFVIYNSAPHAAIAMDLVDVPAKDFKKVGYPRGEIVAKGSRPATGKRGEVSGKGNSTSTAPLDWYPLFVQGGKMQKALERGVRSAPPSL
jgi:hypothetical protein